MMNKNKKGRKYYAYGSTVRDPMNPETSMKGEANPMADRTQQQTVIKQTMPKPQQMPRPERKSKNVEPAAGLPKMAYGGKMRKKMAMGGKNKEFAALAPPKNKITYADKIAGARRND